MARVIVPVLRDTGVRCEQMKQSPRGVGLVTTDETVRRGKDGRARLCSRSAGHAVTQPPAKNNAGAGARKNVPIYTSIGHNSISRFSSGAACENLWHTRTQYLYIYAHTYLRYAADTQTLYTAYVPYSCIGIYIYIQRAVCRVCACYVYTRMSACRQYICLNIYLYVCMIRSEFYK